MALKDMRLALERRLLRITEAKGLSHGKLRCRQISGRYPPFDPEF